MCCRTNPYRPHTKQQIWLKVAVTTTDVLMISVVQIVFYFLLNITVLMGPSTHRIV
jgi:hypothetical protein